MSNNFFAARAFTDLADLNTQARAECEVGGRQTLTPEQRPGVRLAYEAELRCLMPLPLPLPLPLSQPQPQPILCWASGWPEW